MSQQRNILKLLGAKRAEKWAEKLNHGLSGIGGNISLGFILAFLPVVGKFFGAPLDVRHVTLSTGALTFAVCTLGTSALGTSAFQFAALGILIIGTLNFSVSFALALYVAVRARNLNVVDAGKLALGILKLFRKNPLGFFIPPKSEI